MTINFGDFGTGLGIISSIINIVDIFRKRIEEHMDKNSPIVKELKNNIIETTDKRGVEVNHELKNKFHEFIGDSGYFEECGMETIGENDQLPEEFKKFFIRSKEKADGLLGLIESQIIGYSKGLDLSKRLNKQKESLVKQLSLDIDCFMDDLFGGDDNFFSNYGGESETIDPLKTLHNLKNFFIEKVTVLIERIIGLISD